MTITSLRERTSDSELVSGALDLTLFGGSCSLEEAGEDKLGRLE